MKDIDTPYFLHKLKELLDAKKREQSGQSLRRFAHSLSMDPGVLSRLLNGKRKPSIKMMKQLLQRLPLDAQEKERFLQSVIDDQIRRWLNRPQ